MIRTLIIEDEAPAFRRLDTLLSKHPVSFQILEVIDSVDDAVKWLRNHQTPDLIFSDIQLSDGLSFEIYQKIEVRCPIIFTTAYDEYMLDAFRTNGIDYILKPIQEDDLNRSIEKFQRLKNASPEETAPNIEKLLEAVSKREPKFRSRFLVKLGDKLIPVQIEEVAFFVYCEGMTEMHTIHGKRYLIDHPLDELENQLDPERFFRLNRQFLASMEAIGTVHRFFKGKLKVDLHPSPPLEAIVSREKATRFREWLDGV